MSTIKKPKNSSRSLNPIPDISDKDQIVPRAPGIIESHFRAMKGSLKAVNTVDFWKMASFDALTLVFIWIIVLLALIALDRASVPIIESDSASMLALQSGNIDQYQDLQLLKEESATRLEKVQWFVFFFATIMGIFVITLFHDAAWYFAKKKKFTMKKLGSRYMSNLLWVVKWVVIFSLILLALPITLATVFVILGMLVFVYADPSYRNIYDEEKSPLKNTLRGFHSAFYRPYRFIPFLLSLFALLFFVLLLLTVFQSIPAIFMIVSGVALLMVIGWIRHYIILLG